MDVTVVAPIFVGDEIVGWTGSTVHQIDLGGPVEGQVQIGAQSIWAEQPIFPPVKIVDRGVLRARPGARVPASHAPPGPDRARPQGDDRRLQRRRRAGPGAGRAVRPRRRRRGDRRHHQRHRGAFPCPAARAARRHVDAPRLRRIRARRLPDRRGGYEARRCARRRLRRDRRPGPGRHQLHASGVRRRDDRRDPALPVLRHAVVAGRPAARDRRSHARGQRRARGVAGRGVEGDDDRKLHGDDHDQRVPRQVAGGQRASPRAAHGDLDGRAVRRGHVRRRSAR